MLTGLFPTICSDEVPATRDFYVEVFGFAVVFDSGWYVQIAAPSNQAVQIGIVSRSHESVPAAFRHRPAGVLISLEMDDVDAVHALVTTLGLQMPLPLRDEEFGQRHFMTVDPSGTLVDVITAIEPSAEYAAIYGTPGG
jgi:catechol 2,3-dioxygenase-like lactoylglutathione lyase family enzyme